jgi:hypothetical protein
MGLITSIIESYKSNVDWESLFMCEPIVGGTDNIEDMYCIDVASTTVTCNDNLSENDK